MNNFNLCDKQTKKTYIYFFWLKKLNDRVYVDVRINNLNLRNKPITG